MITKTIRDYLANRPDVRKILSNTGWLFSDKVIRMTVGLLVGAWVARYLGTGQYGQLSLALAYLALALPLAKLGLDTVVLRDIVHHENAEERHRILGTAFTLRLISGLILVPLLTLIVMVLRPTDTTIHLFVVLFSIGAIFRAFEVIDFWFRSQVESKYTVYVRNIAVTITAILKVLAILAQAPLLVFGVLYFLDVALFMLGLAVIYHYKEGAFHKWSFSKQQAVTLLGASWPLIFAGLAVSIYSRIDQLMHAQLIPGEPGEEAVGLYAAAVRIAEAWYFVPAAIVSSVFPAILQTKVQSTTLYRKRLQRLFNLMVLISYGVAIPMTFLSRFVTDMLYGSDYAQSAPILAMLTWSGIWVALGLARTPILHAEEVLKFSILATMLGAGSNIMFNLFLIPALGGIGSAIATFISYGISAYLSSFILRTSVPIGKMQTLALIYPNPFKFAKNSHV